jgi:hypothetical protein
MMTQYLRAACFAPGCPWHGGWTQSNLWAKYEGDTHRDLRNGHDPRIEYRRRTSV